MALTGSSVVQTSVLQQAPASTARLPLGSRFALHGTGALLGFPD